MPTLSQILSAKEELSRLDPTRTETIEDRLISRLTDIQSKIDFRNPEMDTLLSLVKTKREMLLSMLDDLESRCERYSTSWHESCRKHSMILTDMVNRSTYEELLEYHRKMYHYNSEFDDHITALLGSHSDWRGSVLLYRMYDPMMLQKFISFYPMYVLDLYREHAQTLRDCFNPTQMRKVRFYDLDHLDQMPKQNMKLIVTYNHFTHCDHDKIIRDLTMLKSLLSPGGTICFNFTDSETAVGASAFESNMRSFVLGSEIRKIAYKLELDVAKWTRLSTVNDTFVELQSKGKWTSIKRAETLGKIIHKHHA